MQKEQPYKWIGFNKGSHGVAWITLKVVASDINEIIDAYLPQEHPNFPFDFWKCSARNGIIYGLKRVPNCWRVDIIDMKAHPCHTNSTIIAYASLRAFWEKVGYNPKKAELEQLERFVYENWGNTEHAVADLETFTLTKTPHNA